MNTESVSDKDCNARFRAAFVHMSEGMAIHQLVYDERGQPIDYKILDVNPAFEHQTGLSAKSVVGKLASEAYGSGEAPFLEIYSAVTVTQQSSSFEHTFQPLNRTFSIKAFGSAKDQFVTIFEDITQRKHMELALQQSEARYRKFAEELPLGVVVTQNGLIKYSNPGSAGLIGFSFDELENKPFLPLVFESDRPWLLELHQKRMRGEEVPSPYVVRMVRKDGQIRHWEMHTSSIVWDGITSGLGIFSDVTDQIKIQESLRISAVAFESQEAMMITDRNSVILRVNQEFTKTTGYSAEEVIGKTPAILKSGRHNEDFYRDMWQQLNATGSWQGEVWDRRKNGEVYPKLLLISAVKNGAGEVTHYVGAHTDITERKSMDELIRSMAYYDPLTQLPNRRLFDDRLEKAIAACKRNGGCGALVFIDLDNFKPLNDSHGHNAGDLLLQEVAQRLTRSVREVDTVARFGGDEFLVVISDLDDGNEGYISQTRAVAEKIHKALTNPYWLSLKRDGKKDDVVRHQCGASIGIVFFDGEGRSEEIIKCADAAMYAAKEAGRNQICFFDAPSSRLQD